MFFFEEGAVEGISGGIKEKLETVKDLDGTSSLNADNATEDPRRRGRRGGGGLAVGGGGRVRVRGLRLRFNPGVVI